MCFLIIFLFRPCCSVRAGREEGELVGTEEGGGGVVSNGLLFFTFDIYSYLQPTVKPTN